MTNYSQLLSNFLRLFPVYCMLLIFMVLGLWVVGIGCYELYYGNKSRSWPVCSGIIRHSEVKCSERTATRDGVPVGKTRTYKPYICYNYDIGGELSGSVTKPYEICYRCTIDDGCYQSKFESGKPTYGLNLRFCLGMCYTFPLL